MFDIPPPQSMIPPVTSPSYPELRYSDAGNTYARNNVGAWVPHPGICNSQILKFVQALTSQWPFHKESGTYALGPAKFASHTDPPSPSSSCIVIHQVPSNNVIDPVLLPLPDNDDLDLTDAVTIAEACGYIPAARKQVHAARPKPQGAKARERKTSHWLSQRSSNNYSNLDVNCLLNMVQDELPLGQCGWQTVHLKYCQWAKVNHWPP
ncbi:hypothetical protein EDB19DRAFT_1836200 [Suillus lakei]|nr:hypothetical protein EDB19DRAFT_1836200 [Suillus lakei]